VFVKDVVGDTALHDAVARNNNDIINMLIECNDTDFKLKNQKGFNVLHEAARRGDVKLVITAPYSLLTSVPVICLYGYTLWYRYTAFRNKGSNLKR